MSTQAANKFHIEKKLSRMGYPVEVNGTGLQLKGGSVLIRKGIISIPGKFKHKYKTFPEVLSILDNYNLLLHC